MLVPIGLTDFFVLQQIIKRPRRWILAREFKQL